MHSSILSQGLKRSWHSCPERVNAGYKNTPSMHHPRRRNVTSSMVGLRKKAATYANFSPKNGESQGWERRRRRSWKPRVWILKNIPEHYFWSVIVETKHGKIRSGIIGATADIGCLQFCLIKRVNDKQTRSRNSFEGFFLVVVIVAVVVVGFTDIVKDGSVRDFLNYQWHSGFLFLFLLPVVALVLVTPLLVLLFLCSSPPHR